MIWLTWRQHRGEVIGVATLLGVLGVLALVTGIPMRAADAPCLQATEACEHTFRTFREQYGVLPLEIATWLQIVAVLAGVLIGAPLLAREYEHGTWQLAWTQGVSRTRWLSVKLILVLGFMAAAGLVLSLVMGWWLDPVIPVGFHPDRFNFAAPVYPSYILLAVAMGVFFGAFIRRTVPAMAATFAVFLPLRLGVESGLRPSYRAPLSGDSGGWASGNWVLERLFVDSAGRPLTRSAEEQLLNLASDGDLEAVARRLGFRQSTTYHPASRFWEFQFIEAAIFGGLALALTALIVWRVRRG
ncbi:ABC transporter permease [Nonomuraea sp. LPB2021202275-12-8]|uniref:ABC transporter permease n=1 Tax=Nonomuraea sp. LPB2021202275-12-8 TaxID=3120159 RepID=UPI00300CBFCE